MITISRPILSEGERNLEDYEIELQLSKYLFTN